MPKDTEKVLTPEEIQALVDSERPSWRSGDARDWDAKFFFEDMGDSYQVGISWADAESYTVIQLDEATEKAVLDALDKAFDEFQEWADEQAEEYGR